MAVIDGGVSSDPETLVRRAVDGGADVIAISTYNGVALRYARDVIGCLAGAGLTIPVCIGGKLNQIPEDSNSGLPVDVTGEIRALGVEPCPSLDALASMLANSARHRGRCAKLRHYGANSPSSLCRRLSRSATFCVVIPDRQNVMATNLVLSAMSRQRATLAGEIEALDAKLGQLRAALVHLDAAIRIMCPDAEPELIRPRKPSRKGCDWFGRQELPRLILAGLREAGRPLSTVEIARAMMVCKGMDAGDVIALQRVTGMVKDVLHRQDGRTVAKDGKGWRISS